MGNENTLQIITYSSLESEWGVLGSSHRRCLGWWRLLCQMLMLCVQNQGSRGVAIVQHRWAPPERGEPQVRCALDFESIFHQCIFRNIYSLQSLYLATWTRNISGSLCFWFWINFWTANFQKPFWAAKFLTILTFGYLAPHWVITYSLLRYPPDNPTHWDEVQLVWSSPWKLEEKTTKWSTA